MLRIRKHIPKPTCTDLEECDIELQILSDAVLWGTDYEDAQMYIDFPPEKSKELRDWMNVPDDYFTASLYFRILIYTQVP